jgi:integrase
MGNHDGSEFIVDFPHPDGVETVEERLYTIALERNLRRSSVLAYKRSLIRLGLLALPLSEATPARISEALWQVDNVNTRRGDAIAARAVTGHKIKIPRGIPRRYDKIDEDTVRLALMTSPHEIRGLLMAFCGLRLGEACAITAADLTKAGQGVTRLRVDKQLQILRETGKPRIVRTAEVKTTEADVAIPAWLAERVRGLTKADIPTNPDNVRESLRRAGQKAGINLTPTMLRHWHATTLLERGVNIKVVSRQLRHSHIQTTLTHYVDYDLDGDVGGAFG